MALASSSDATCWADRCGALAQLKIAMLSGRAVHVLRSLYVAIQRRTTALRPMILWAGAPRIMARRANSTPHPGHLRSPLV
jgi:hypothetical protein